MMVAAIRAPLWLIAIIIAAGLVVNVVRWLGERNGEPSRTPRDHTTDSDVWRRD